MRCIQTIALRWTQRDGVLDQRNGIRMEGRDSSDTLKEWTLDWKGKEWTLDWTLGKVG